jgi:hypothetical protein
MRVKILLLAVLLLGAVGAEAQSWYIQGADRYFRVEASPGQGRRGPIVSGYVYNDYGQTADRVWLLIEALDGSGQVTASSRTMVVGTVPNGGRSYFEAPAPGAGSSYRVRVTTYEWIGRGA